MKGNKHKDTHTHTHTHTQARTYIHREYQDLVRRGIDKIISQNRECSLERDVKRT